MGCSVGVARRWVVVQEAALDGSVYVVARTRSSPSLGPTSVDIRHQLALATPAADALTVARDWRHRDTRA